MTPVQELKFETRKRHKRERMTLKDERLNYGTLRNHIIPQFHMRNFAETIAYKDMVYLYNLENAKKVRNYKPKRLTVENAAVQKGFYTDEYESRLAEEYESPAAPAITKMITGQALTFDEREAVAAYLLSYNTRSPSLLTSITEMYSLLSGEYINHIKENFSTIKEALVNRGEPIDEKFFEKIAQYRGEETQYTRLGAKLFAEGKFPTSGMMQKATTLLASLKWRIFNSESQPFILGDTFVTMEALDQPFYELYAPLGSHHCLFVSRYVHDLSTRRGIERIPISQANTKAINVRTAKVATKYLVSGTDNLTWVKRARQTPDKSHRNITIPGFTNPRILNEFMTKRCPNCWYSLQERERDAFHTEVGEVTNGQVMVNRSVQSKCSHCHFATDFQSPTDSRKYHIGAQAARIRDRLIPPPE